MRKKIISVFTALLCVGMLAGCGKKTLEQKLGKSQLKEMNDEAYNTYVKNGTDYKDIKIEVEGNNLYYKYWYNFELTDDMIAYLEKNSASIKSQIEPLKNNIKKECGVKPEKISYIFYDVNDEEVLRVEE